MFVISVKKADLQYLLIQLFALHFFILSDVANKKSLSRQGKAFFVCGADGARTRDLLRDRQAC